MHYSIPALVWALPAFTYAVSLNDFPPRLANLPDACEAIYTQQIDGCKPSDFASGGCSAACVHGLDDMTTPILRNCQGVRGQNILAAFLAGDGPSSVCNNANSVLSGSGSDGSGSSQSQSDSGPSTTASSVAQTPRPVRETTSSSTRLASSSSSREVPASTSTTLEVSSSTTATPVGASGTATASSFTTTKSGLLVDTSSAPSGAHTQGATASQTTELSPQQSLMKDGSGGGSPFDSTGNVSNSAAGSTHFSAFALSAFTVASAAILLLSVEYW